MIDEGTGSNHIVGGETVGERLVRIETKVDLLLNNGMDHEQRLRKLETKSESPLRSYAIPIAMLASVCSAAAAAWAFVIR